eukprot:491894_1
MATTNSQGGYTYHNQNLNYRQHSVPFNYRNNHNNMHHNNINHSPQNTNPDSMQQMPSLLQLSQVNSPATPDNQHAQVFSFNNNQKRKPKKNLPTRPLPTLPSQPNNHQRQRSKSDMIETTHQLGAIQINYDLNNNTNNNNTNNNNTKQIMFTSQPY